MHKLVLGSCALLIAMFVSLSPDATGQPPAKNKTAPPKSVDKAPDKTTDEVTVIELYKDTGGKFRFRIKHGDTNLAMASKGYEDKAECMKVIKQIQSDVAKAKIDDQSK